MENLTIPAAFFAGLLSFFSGCVLPLLPAYFSFITGLSLEELTNPDRKKNLSVIVPTLAYIAGFSLVFLLYGLSASYLGILLADYKWLIRYIGGGLVIIFGLHLLGIININFLNMEKRMHIRNRPLRLTGVFIVGMAFAAGWTPCFGPMLGAIFGLATQEGKVFYGIALFGVYAFGLAIPFLLISIFIDKLLIFLSVTRKWIQLINRVSGVFLIIVGLLLIFDRLRISSFF